MEGTAGWLPCLPALLFSFFSGVFGLFAVD